MIKTFIFASLRGQNFKAVGHTVEEAFKALQEQEKDEGSLWRLFDQHMVRNAVRNGWSEYRAPGEMPCAYKEGIQVQT